MYIYILKNRFSYITLPQNLMASNSTQFCLSIIWVVNTWAIMLVSSVWVHSWGGGHLVACLGQGDLGWPQSHIKQLVHTLACVNKAPRLSTCLWSMWPPSMWPLQAGAGFSPRISGKYSKIAWANSCGPLEAYMWPHSIRQSNSQGQPRLTGWRNTVHPLTGEQQTYPMKRGAYRNGKKYRS